MTGEPETAEQLRERARRIRDAAAYSDDRQQYRRENDRAIALEVEADQMEQAGKQAP